MKRKDSIARRASAVAALALGLAVGPAATAAPLSFGVVPQRTATLTAQYWNPILNHVGERSGIALELRLARSGRARGLSARQFDLA